MKQKEVRSAASLVLVTRYWSVMEIADWTVYVCTSISTYKTDLHHC